ncbi:CehA/McbA family metallohydrolase [Halorubrum tibetense]|uniref:CehA/McbA family metallohydrolase n=1 Tax=Halorubrum tibetense TaxID=175631 RepID=A0ABD5SBM1_9EURY
MSRVTVRIDPHVHSDDSYDGHEPVELILEHAADIGLDAVVITDHDTMGESLRAAALAPEYGLIGIPGVEVSTAHGHLLAIGVDRMPPRRESYADTVAWIREHGGVAIVPHPFQRSRHGVRRRDIPVPEPSVNTERSGGTAAENERVEVEATTSSASTDRSGASETAAPIEIDAVEVFNAWLFTGYWNRRARRFAAKHGYPGVAASDAHHLNYVGRAYTELTVEGRDRVADVTADDVLAAIRAGTTSVSGKRAPVPMAAKHYVTAGVRKSGYAARTGTRRGVRGVTYAIRESASIARVAGYQAIQRASRAASWLL